MELSVLAELDLRYRANFFHDENVERDTEWVSGYSYLVGGTTFTGRAVDLSASVCEGLITELGFHADDVWLGYGVSFRNEFRYAAIVRHEGRLYELGRLDQGGYGNSYGRPYRAPVEVQYSDVGYEQLYRFDLQRFLTVIDGEWPLGSFADDVEEKHVEHVKSLSEADIPALEEVSGMTIMPVDDAPRSGKLTPVFSKENIMDKVKGFLTQPFVILAVAVLFALIALAMPELWDFLLGGSILLVVRSFVNVALLLAGVWLCRVARALIVDGGSDDEVKNLGGFVYIAVALVVLGANLSLSL